MRQHRKNNSANLNSKRIAARKARIHRFALIWMQLYKNHDRIPHKFFEEPIFVGDELKVFGFDLDNSHLLARDHHQVQTDITLAEWKELLKNVGLQALGNAVFSKWRYFNHWAMEPMKEEDYEWFVLAFEKMADLTACK